MAAIKVALKEMGTMLKQQTTVLPKIEYTIESNLNDIVKEFKETNTEYFNEKFSLSNAMFEFTMGNVALIDSKILKTTDQSLMLKKWISNGSVRFKLLWRGTRDGFTSTAFHAKCDKFKPTITLASATTGKIFGGFTDQDWTVISNYKPTSNAFLFSITNKEKYFIKQSNTQGTNHATYTNANYLPTFGGGHDLYFAESCDKNSTSYANFNYSYDAKGRTRDDLTGAYNFQVKELEMYHVEYSGTLLTDPKKSK